jgi:hypothetical protein
MVLPALLIAIDSLLPLYFSLYAAAARSVSINMNETILLEKKGASVWKFHVTGD